MAESFPRRSARTQRFTLGEPRALRVAADGRRVTFLRRPDATTRRHALWALDLEPGAPRERLVCDPLDLLDGGAEELSAQERARRERSREGAAGIVGYATDARGDVAAFAVSGRLVVVDLRPGGDPAREVPVAGPVLDPRPDPTGQRVAYARGGGLHVVDLADGSERSVAAANGPPTVAWGTAEFVAAEEMDRDRGFWWAPDGRSLLVERYDEAPVGTWHLADPAEPAAAPVAVRYPAAGTANAEVGLWLVDLDGYRREVRWDRTRLPYLAAVGWPDTGDPLLLVQSRDQRRCEVLSVGVSVGVSEPAAGDPSGVPTTVVASQDDPVWVDLVAGVPARYEGRLVLTGDDGPDPDAPHGTRRLLVDGRALTPPGLQVRAVLGVDADGVLVSASTRPETVSVVAVGWDGSLTTLGGSDGVADATRSGGTVVLTWRGLDVDGARTTVHREGAEVAQVGSLAEIPPVTPQVRLLRGGPRRLATAVLLPTGHRPGSRRLPVLVDPYGGPHAQRVLASRRAFLEPQWWADQGFAVVVADGRGTPGRGPGWERAVHRELASVPLEDQVDALHAAAEAVPDLDLGAVAIRGWSFGGYLAALAVLRRPDVFHAAVAGAPVTDWRLYDTHDTERYLGDPSTDPQAYERNSLLADAAGLQRPLLLVHGLADDNVVVAHTLRLSRALLEAGRPHEVLPLSGVTHMTPQEAVAENLLLLQLDFLRRALRLA